MNLRTFDFHVTAIDRALLGLIEERARLVSELDTAAPREPDLDELLRTSSGELSSARLATLFDAVHRATQSPAGGQS